MCGGVYIGYQIHKKQLSVLVENLWFNLNIKGTAQDILNLAFCTIPPSFTEKKSEINFLFVHEHTLNSNEGLIVRFIPIFM